MQEKWLRGMKIAHWKLPGGVLDPGMYVYCLVGSPSRPLVDFSAGENVWETAIREVLEETGIRTEFVSLLSFRHMHKYNWGIDDLYFACLLRPLNTDIRVNPAEIAEAKWRDVG